MEENEATPKTNRISARFSSIVDSMLSWNLVQKARLLIILLLVFPALAGLIILEISPQRLESFLVLLVLAGIILLVPMSQLISHFLVLRELFEIEQFCRKFRSGNYSARFKLPPQKENESDLLALKRNLNWMAHLISRRELGLKQELKNVQQQRILHERRSMLDPLTGLYNRRGLKAKLADLASEARTTTRPLVAVFLDVDKFKSVNDTLGHRAGDELLRNLGGILRDNIREDLDIPFRYGGDEFGILLVDIDSKQAEVICGRIIRAYNAAHGIGDTSLSVGIIEMSKMEEDYVVSAQKMITMADQASYEAKRNGGNRIYIAQVNGVNFGGSAK